MQKIMSVLILTLTLAIVSSAGEVKEPQYDWQLEDSYNPPDFEKYFPDDKEAGRELDKLQKAIADECIKAIKLTRSKKAGMPDYSKAQSMLNDLTLVRNGFRNVENRKYLLLLLYGRYVRKNPPDPEAVEILYHAADPKNKYSTQHDAVSPGLLHMRPVKPPAVLRAFIDITMTGNELYNIRRGCRNTRQLDEIRFYLKPYLEKRGTKEYEIAVILDQFFSVPANENSSFMKTEREIHKVIHADALAGVKSDLMSNDTLRKIKAFRAIQPGQKLFYMVDESLLDILQTLASDSNPLVRKNVPNILERIITMSLYETKSVNTKVKSLLEKLSEDHNQEVQDSASKSLLKVENLAKQIEEALRKRNGDR